MNTNVKLNEIPVQHVAASVVFKGQQITLPEGMTIATAVQTMLEFERQQMAVVKFTEEFDVFPWDGANALKQVLNARFGFVNFQGREKTVESGPHSTISVPWGSFSIPNLADFGTSVGWKEGRAIFQINATVFRRNEPVVRTVFKDLKDYLAAGNSMYQGKAIKLRLQTDDGEPLEMPEPKFIDVDVVDTSNLLFTKQIEDLVRVNLFTPLERLQDMKASGLPLKRAVALVGKYGTGKTMLATAAAKVAVANNVTYLYIQRASELASAIAFVKPYSVPAAVIFCEDIDREVRGHRTAQMDDLLNVVDGLDTKDSNIMLVVTSNDVNSIHPAMLRPGRLDAVIHVTPPDEETAERIIRKYCGLLLAVNDDISEAAKLMAGQIPAVIAEVVKRAKLAQLSLQPKGTRVFQLSGEAINIQARLILGQVQLLEQRIKADETKPKVSIDDLIRNAASMGYSDGPVEVQAVVN